MNYENNRFLLSDTNVLLHNLVHDGDSSFVFEKIGTTIRNVMIDEFQDIDELQYKLMSVLCGYHKNLFIVGDPDQTIYTWRGANVRYLLDFDKIFPSVKTIMMMQNYRSTPQIVSVVNDLIDKK